MTCLWLEQKSRLVILKRALVGIFIKKELNLKGKVKVVVAERLFVIRKGIELFLFMDLPKTKNQTCPKKS